MNTEKISTEQHLQILFEGSLVNSEKTNRKGAVDPKENLPVVDSDLTKKIEISIRPNKHAMDTLVAYLRKSYVTYRLTPLIQLFLEKKDRFEILLTPLNPDVLFCTQNENLPFLSKKSAFDYLTKKYWADVFEKEVIPLKPIPGHFASINRCGITNVLLGPPNYHLYNDLIKEHYNQYLAQSYSWDFFVQQIKNEHNPLLVKQWQNGTSEHIVFRLKSDPQICFDSSRAAQEYLQKHPHLIRDTVKHRNAFSLSYAEVDNVRDEFLREQIYQKIKDENRSPISLGCFCRTRFRHAGLHLYKKRKGSSHTSFLCSVKRKVRTGEDCKLSAALARIVDYIEQHPMINIATCIADICSSSAQQGFIDASIFKENLLKKDLVRLIKAGYVIQFEDGSLYVTPKQTVSHKGNRTPKMAAE